MVIIIIYINISVQLVLYLEFCKPCVSVICQSFNGKNIHTAKDILIKSKNGKSFSSKRILTEEFKLISNHKSNFPLYLLLR